MKRDFDTRALLAHQIVLHFRDKISGGHADLGDDAWWVEDMLDRIERAITPHLGPSSQATLQAWDVPGDPATTSGPRGNRPAIM